MLVEVNCETDFGAGSEQCQAMGKDVARVALDGAPGRREALLGLTDAQASSLDDRRRALVAKIGEKIDVRRFVRVTSPGPLGTYTHGARIGSVVALQGGDEPLARDLAMHVAAVNPAYIDAGAVPSDVLAKERAILTEQTQGEKKPPDIIAKMVEGRLRKYLAEITFRQLLREGSGHYGGEIAKSAGAKVVQSVRYEVGAASRRNRTISSAKSAPRSRRRKRTRTTVLRSTKRQHDHPNRHGSL